MNVLMIGVDKTSVGGMLTVVENYLNDKEFCNQTNWDLFHFLLKKYCIKAPINNPTEEITKYQMECMSAESL